MIDEVEQASSHSVCLHSVAGLALGTPMDMNGAFAEYCRIPESSVLKLPDAMTYQEGAAMPLPHWTAGE